MTMCEAHCLETRMKWQTKHTDRTKNQYVALPFNLYAW